MNTESWLPALATQALMMSPYVIAYAAGIVLCLSWRGRIGVGAVYAVTAFSLQIAGVVLSLAGQAWMYRMIASGSGAAAAGMSSGVFGVLHMLLSVVAIGLLIAAVLVKRPAPPQA